MQKMMLNTDQYVELFDTIQKEVKKQLSAVVTEARKLRVGNSIFLDIEFEGYKVTTLTRKNNKAQRDETGSLFQIKLMADYGTWNFDVDNSWGAGNYVSFEATYRIRSQMPIHVTDQ